MGGVGAPDKLIVKGKRLDGRKVDELRPTKIRAGIIKNAEGSAEIIMGETKVIAAVYGPREVVPRHKTKEDRLDKDKSHEQYASYLGKPQRARLRWHC